MTTISGSLRLRPTRIGFLVDPNDLESLRRIFQVCACSWGGVFNPIIPVCDALPEAWTDPPFTSPTPVELAAGYLRFFEPDVFVEARPGLAEKIGLARTDLDFGDPRVITLDAYCETPNSYPFAMPFGMDSFDIYKAMYEREFKFVSRHERRVALFEADSADAAFLEAAFGGFRSEGPLQGRAKAYTEAFEPAMLAATADNWVKVITEGYRLPLSFTREGLKRENNGWSEPTLFIVDPASPLDLIDLWNIRQIHPQVLGVNLNWVQSEQAFLTEFVEANHRPLPLNPNGVMIRTLIQFGRSVVPRDRTQAVQRAQTILADTGISRLGFDIYSMSVSYDRIWSVDGDDFSRRSQRAEIRRRQAI